MNIQEIKVDKFPLVIITDVHTAIKRVQEVKNLYPHSNIICLGDITDLFSTGTDEYNAKIIDYFIENKIPCLLGNHEQFILGCEDGNSFIIGNVCDRPKEYNLQPNHIAWLRTLPLGFKLAMPDGSHYLCFHNKPNDLWGFVDCVKYPLKWLTDNYPIENNTRAILIGHNHKTFAIDFTGISCKLIGISDLVRKKIFVVLTETGIRFKRL